MAPDERVDQLIKFVGQISDILKSILNELTEFDKRISKLEKSNNVTRATGWMCETGEHHENDCHGHETTSELD